MGAGSIVRVAILGEEKGLKEAVHLATKDLDKLAAKAKSTSEKATAHANKAVAVMGAGALAIAGIAIRNGDQLNESFDQLTSSLDNAGQSSKGLQKRLDPLQKTMEKYGYTNAQVNDSIRAQVEAHVPLAEAIKRESLIADLAKKKHLDLATSTLLVTKAGEGFTKPLKALALDLPIASGGAVKLAAAEAVLTKAHTGVYLATLGVRDAQAKASALIADAEHKHLKGAAAAKVYAQANALVSTAQGKLTKAQLAEKAAQEKVNTTAHAGAQILDALGKSVKGGALESTKSLAGKTAALKAKFTDMTAHLGQKLIPILLTLGVDIGKVTEFLGKHKAILDIVIAAVGLYVAAITTLFIIDKVKKMQEAWTKVQAAFNVVMDANPIVLVVGAIALLVVGVVIAYKKVKWFHDAVQTVWEALQTGYHWVTKNWPLLLAILTGPFGLAVLLISRHWDTIVGFVKAIPGRIASFAAHLWDHITDAWDTAVHWVGTRGAAIVAWVKGLPRTLLNALGSGVRALTGIGSGIVGGIADGIAGAYHLIGGALHTLFSHIPGFSTIAGIAKHIPGVSQIISFAGFSDGGIVNYPRTGRLAMLHGREAIVPLDRPRAAARVLSQAGLMGSARGDGGSGGGLQVFNFPAGVSPTAVAAATRRRNARNGVT